MTIYELVCTAARYSPPPVRRSIAWKFFYDDGTSYMASANFSEMWARHASPELRDQDRNLSVV